MARKVRSTFIIAVATFIFLASINYHHLIPDQPIVSAQHLQLWPPPVPYYPRQTNPNYAIREDEEPEEEATHKSSRHVTAVADSISTVSILLPDWEVVVVVSPETQLSIDSTATGDYTCLFLNSDSSPAKPLGILPSPDRMTFICEFPESLRRRLPFLQPVLTKSIQNQPDVRTPTPQLLRWNFLVYETLSTETDVIVFVKGINNRQGRNRQPKELRCVFGDDVINGARTAVTTSMQEVFRCQRPELKAFERIKVSLEISEKRLVIPSVAYYTPSRKITSHQPKSLLCACTMVYNVSKFLKEWVAYHSAIGIEKFILYDNDSDDDLERVVAELVQQGYNVSTLFWLWPKTQEAGFSHCAIFAKDHCTWMTYIDVDEFVYSPSWLNSSNPSNQMLKSLLPKSSSSSSSSIPEESTTIKVGQVMISCFEFGPSNQKSHPAMGVTQGYNCRRRSDNRHKSIVLLDAIDRSLLNVVHHFRLKKGYRAKKLRKEEAVVNHYKFQAWDDFKTKFRRRVSAYVADWTQTVNPKSKDRTPGLGYAPVEPRGWSEKFCEVYDDRLKGLTERWFGIESSSGYQMAWQR